jgi:hypothetical protein
VHYTFQNHLSQLHENRWRFSRIWKATATLNGAGFVDRKFEDDRRFVLHARKRCKSNFRLALLAAKLLLQTFLH